MVLPGGRESPALAGLQGLLGSCCGTDVLLGDAAVKLTKLLLLHGSDGGVSRDCHERTAPCLVQQAGGPILQPPQHRLLPLDSRAGSGSSHRLPQGSAAAPRGSATWDRSRQMHLSSSVALSRLWVDLVPFLAQKENKADSLLQADSW